jgi:hypothetical protein
MKRMSALEAHIIFCIFAASSFSTNILIYLGLENISWGDGVDNGLGIGIFRWVLSFALILLYVIILIDPMSRRTKAEVA